MQAAGATLVAVSPQSPQTAAEQVQAEELDFPVVTDAGAMVADRYGLVFELSESLRPIYDNFGIDIPGSNGDDSFRLPLAATYVIDQNGMIKWAFVSTDYTTRAEPGDILDALEDL